ncbi:hypothetical protein ACWPKO_23590 (plasmid) [Coraliomargarita sp. W4R53]
MTNVWGRNVMMDARMQSALGHTSDIQEYVENYVQFLIAESNDRVAAARDPRHTPTEQERHLARGLGAAAFAHLLRELLSRLRDVPVATGLLIISAAARSAIQDADPTNPAAAAISIYAIRLIHVLDDWRVFVAALGGSHKPLRVDFPPDPDEI